MTFWFYRAQPKSLHRFENNVIAAGHPMYTVRERVAARQSAEASVWLFAKEASQIAHLCMAELRKDLTYRATGLQWLFLPSYTPPSARFHLVFFFHACVYISSCHPSHRYLSFSHLYVALHAHKVSKFARFSFAMQFIKTKLLLRKIKTFFAITQG